MVLADPDKYFRISLELAAVRNEDFEAVRDAMTEVRDKFCRGGSGISVESLTEGTVLNRAST